MTLLPVQEAADDAGVKPRTVRRWIAAGRITAHYIDGRLHVDWSELNKAEAATRQHGGRRRTWDKRAAMS